MRTYLTKTKMVSTETQDSVYKVFTEVEWKLFQKTGQFSGSEDDLRDGFIHLSRKNQVKNVIKKYFSRKAPVYVATFSNPGLLKRIKWETSSSNDVYPHLYDADLLLSEVSNYVRL